MIRNVFGRVERITNLKQISGIDGAFDISKKVLMNKLSDLVIQQHHTLMRNPEPAAQSLVDTASLGRIGELALSDRELGLNEK